MTSCKAKFNQIMRNIHQLIYSLSIFAILSFTLPLCSKPAETKPVPVNEEQALQSHYGTADAATYLTGRFNPANHPDFALVKNYSIDDNNRGIYLRKETLEALQKLHTQLKKDLPDVSFWVQSGTRNYYHQKAIWESKWNGKVMVGGINLTTIANPVERARRILSYSSMPGTSRHHWGTDFDINSLTVDYYKTGKGKKLYDWMVENAPKYDFCLPYSQKETSGRKGYEFEPWHWSYKPLSKIFVKEWESLYNQGKINGSQLDFDGAASSFPVAIEYVSGISADCR